MKEKITQYIDQLKSLWSNSTLKQKVLFFSGAGIVIALIVVITILSTATNYVPLYSNLAVQEVAQIKEELDSRNVSYEIKDAGTTILVPEEVSDQLLVDLAGQGIPRSGNIDYSFFSENSSWGITDNEFNMMKLDAMQTELANLITSIDGIQEAQVMINLPQESVFVSDSAQEASASIVIHTDFGHEFEGNQIESLYHLVSKAVPNLPPENIVIMNQYFEYFDQTTTASSAYDDYTQQQEIKRSVERDIQSRLQQMLGVMVGMDKVLVSVTADLDFTRENRVEELVEPVDIENMEGIPVSIETIQETFEGAQEEGGVVGVGEEDIANYPAGFVGQDGDYEMVKETINYELNRLHRDIAESPYKLRDLGIQVVVDSVRSIDGDEVELLTAQEQAAVEDSIASIVSSMITTSINDEEYGEVQLEDNISIVFQEFSGRPLTAMDVSRSIPLWIYIVGGILLVAIIILVILLLRNRSPEREEQVIDQPIVETEEIEVPDISVQPKTEADIQQEQLEKMAREKPEDFAKLLRTWIADD